MHVVATNLELRQPPLRLVCHPVVFPIMLRIVSEGVVGLKEQLLERSRRKAFGAHAKAAGRALSLSLSMPAFCAGGHTRSAAAGPSNANGRGAG